ncbi:hypothetical protein LWI29_034371 [Acer saccharum]|uniref:Uncharacterized protein n=1 Tax=Acer saccharum TaxID=4024 RepID=A0AA39SGJ2_ACESA|nr:hypothetical protein LWI29_034371 [Acer saccharum]
MTKKCSHDRQKDEKGQKGYPRESRGNARANKFRGRYNHYTPLTGDQEEILSVVEDKGLAKYPGSNQQMPGEIQLKKPQERKKGHDPITFTAEDSDGIDAKPNDAIVVGVRIAHRDVLRVMIDNGRFGGAEVRSLGTVKLPVRFGTAPCRRTILLDFVVVDIHNWPYNALLGRPFLNKARAVTSTHALKIKFPTEFGVGELRGSQEMARRANLSIFKDKAGMETLSIFEVDREVQEDNPENFELDPRDKTSREKEEPTESVVLDEAEPDKIVKIGARLTEQVKKDVTSLLKEIRGFSLGATKICQGLIEA